MRHDRFGALGHLLGYLAALIALFSLFSASYGITSVVYRFTGRPCEILTHVFTGILTIALIIVIVQILLKTRGVWRHDGFHSNHSQITDALAQIAMGNFDVLLDTDARGWQNEIAEAFNEMARNLGTLETMRQDFISNVSHEIQSPLTSISGFAALIQKDDLPDGERRRYAAVIEAESKRLSSLSDNLLKLSSLDNDKIPLNKQEFRLDKQLEHIALTLEPQWSAKNLTLEADLPKLTIYADEDLLSQAWMNLLHNAVKFTPEGGQISIALTADGESVSVKITDTGEGIAPEDQIHIFERFYKADKARDRALGGNGLGLSLVKKIVELHGGSVALESKVGEGTAFQIRLNRRSGDN